MSTSSMFSPWLGILFPLPCLSCGIGDQPCCANCWPKPEIHRGELDGLPLVSAQSYEAVKSFLLPYKDQSLVSLTRVLAPLAATALRASVRGAADPLTVVFPPSSRANFRKRGFNPAERILRLALPRAGVQVKSAFRWTRGTTDQGHLTQRDRGRNVAGAMQALISNQANLLVFDDVIASGSTMREMRRALEQGGNQVLGFCVVAESFLKNDIVSSR